MYIYYKYLLVTLNLGDSAIKSLLDSQSRRKFSEGLHEIAALCHQQEPSLRPTAAQLLTHPYFRFHRKHMHLPEYLLPALPLSDKVAYNRGKLEYLNIFLFTYYVRNLMRASVNVLITLFYKKTSRYQICSF